MTGRRVREPRHRVEIGDRDRGNDDGADAVRRRFHRHGVAIAIELGRVADWIIDHKPAQTRNPLSLKIMTTPA